MDPSHSPGPAAAGITVEDPLWRRAVSAPERAVRRALRAAGARAEVVLASDETVKRLNAAWRGRNKPTNVLTFDPPAPGLPGGIILARGVVLREARAAGRAPAAHLAHLVVHGALHLAGHDHHHPGEARRMEMAEARILARIGIANPWKGPRGWA